MKSRSQFSTPTCGKIVHILEVSFHALLDASGYQLAFLLFIEIWIDNEEHRCVFKETTSLPHDLVVIREKTSLEGKSVMVRRSILVRLIFELGPSDSLARQPRMRCLWSVV